MVIASPREPWNFLPYYGVLLAIIAVLLWLLTSRLVVPLRKLANVMDEFGAGNLGARFNDSRRDEIGSLGNSFNQMADRVQTLLVAERRLLQDVSHELRSPLARLSFAVRLARTAPDREAAIDRVKKEIDRLTELVSSLIEVTRAEGDPTERPADTVQLDELLDRVSADCQLDAQSKNCRIHYRGASDVKVAGNEELLRRAVENVTRNAIRYAPAGSEVQVSMDKEGQEAVVQIRDYGPGVPEEKLSRIFDPFFRVEASRDSTEGGVGLGLAIARRAVSVHNGSIQARNMNPGLCVVMRLPLAANGVRLEVSPEK
jgi:two-component system sensor histidine kinase CpxA